jgi:Putative peptidoglycan binding domain
VTYNPYIAEQRAAFKDELAQPAVLNEVYAMMVTEDDENPIPVFESLLNRTCYVNSHGWGRTLRAMIQGGFYGPYNRGMYPRTIAEINANPSLKAKCAAAVEACMDGSDLIKGFTDQGLPTDPNGQRQPQLRLGGNIFNDWAGGPNGHDGAEAWRQQFEAAAAKVAVKPVPEIGLYTTENLQIALNYFGADPQLDVDSVFGPATEAALKTFQKEQGLTVDGRPGPLTWAEIDNRIVTAVAGA